MSHLDSIVILANSSALITYFSTPLAQKPNLILLPNRKLLAVARQMNRYLGNEKSSYGRFPSNKLALLGRMTALRLRFGTRPKICLGSTFATFHLILSVLIPHARFTYLDDGLSTYAMTRAEVNRSKWPKLFSSRIKNIQASSTPYSDALYEEAFLFFPDLLSPSATRHKIAESQYRKSLRLLCRLQIPVEKLPASGDASYALMIMGGEAVDDTLLSSTISSLVQHGYTVLIKPHPRHSPRDLKDIFQQHTMARLLTTALPAEGVMLEMGDKLGVVVGAPSTALMLGAAYIGTKVQYLRPVDAKVTRFGYAANILEKLNIKPFTG